MKAKIIRLAVFICSLIILPVSCGKEYPFATESDCNDCFTEKPEYGTLKISLNSKVSDSAVIVKVFDGKFTEDMLNDDSKLLFIDTTRESSIEVDVLVDKDYSAVAEYVVDQKKYLVIDGDKIKRYSIESTCDFDCWIIRGGKINCKLKY